MADVFVFIVFGVCVIQPLIHKNCRNGYFVSVGRNVAPRMGQNGRLVAVPVVGKDQGTRIHVGGVYQIYKCSLKLTVDFQPDNYLRTL